MEYGRLNPMPGTSSEAVTSETLAAIRQLIAEQDVVVEDSASASSSGYRSDPTRVTPDAPRVSHEPSRSVSQQPLTLSEFALTEPPVNPGVPVDGAANAPKAASKTIFERLFGK